MELRLPSARRNEGESLPSGPRQADAATGAQRKGAPSPDKRLSTALVVAQTEFRAAKVHCLASSSDTRRPVSWLAGHSAGVAFPGPKGPSGWRTDGPPDAGARRSQLQGQPQIGALGPLLRSRLSPWASARLVAPDRKVRNVASMSVFWAVVHRRCGLRKVGRGAPALGAGVLQRERFRFQARDDVVVEGCPETISG